MECRHHSDGKRAALTMEMDGWSDDALECHKLELADAHLISKREKETMRGGHASVFHICRELQERKSEGCALSFFRSISVQLQRGQTSVFAAGTAMHAPPATRPRRRGLSNARRFLRVKMTRSTKFEAPCLETHGERSRRDCRWS